MRKTVLNQYFEPLWNAGLKLFSGLLIPFQGLINTLAIKLWGKFYLIFKSISSFIDTRFFILYYFDRTGVWTQIHTALNLVSRLSIFRFLMKESSTVGHEKTKKIVGVLLSLTRVLLSGIGVLLSGIFKNIYCWSSYVFGVLLSLGFYCRFNIWIYIF